MTEIDLQFLQFRCAHYGWITCWAGRVNPLHTCGEVAERDAWLHPLRPVQVAHEVYAMESSSRACPHLHNESGAVGQQWVSTKRTHRGGLSGLRVYQE